MSRAAAGPALRTVHAYPYTRVLARALRVLNLASVGVSFADLVTDLGVSKRTVFRDLERLQKAGFIVRLHRDEGLYRCASFDALADGITLREAAALLLYVQDGLRPTTGTTVACSLHAAVHKMCRVISGATTHLQRDLDNQMVEFEYEAVTPFPDRSLLFPEDPDAAPA